VDKKVAVYLCRGCGIGDALDVEALNKVATDNGKAPVCRAQDCSCSDEGVAEIRKDIEEGANSIVIAGCSQRFNADVFNFEGCLITRVNLREHVVWSHEPKNEDTQALAADYLRMGIARAEKAELPAPFNEDIDKTILVVGGGISGMSAALESAKAGYDVILVEKEAELGGRPRKFPKAFPHRPPYREIEDSTLSKVVQEVMAHERIKVHTSTAIRKITGQPGQFDATLNIDGTEETTRVGAIIQATGWKPYDPHKLDHLGYGKSANVITNTQMEELLGTGKLVRPSDGKPPKRIAFIQCAGSRDPDHLPYCSAVCCRVALKQVMLSRQLSPETEAYVLYKDMRTPAQYEDFYRRAQEDTGVFFTKGEVTKVAEGSGGGLLVDLENTLIEKEIQIEADLVVLATGMVPQATDSENVRKLLDAKMVVAKGEAGAQLDQAKKDVEELKHLEGTGILNLDYRQGPDAPVLKYNFPDSHFICFPYETRRTGIYMAGCVRAPNDTDMCKLDAAGAAMKAIQCLELSSRGEAVHPRWGDNSYPDFFLQRCTQCKRCTEECPFGTLNEDAKGTPQPNPTRCRRCGICLGACPERIISFKDYSVPIVSNMIKAVEIPDAEEEKPRMLGFLCENDAYPALDLAGLQRMKYSAHIRFIPVRCLGSVNIVWIADALSNGFDGILLIGCKSGDDYQCHYVRGSELMGTRGGNVREKLKQLALEEERVRVEELAISDFDKLPGIVDDFAKQIEGVGLNPFKGF